MRKLMFPLVATLAFGSFAMANMIDVSSIADSSYEAVNRTIEIEKADDNFNQENEIISCFELVHNLYTALHGGVNLDNVASFNAAVEYCQRVLYWIEEE